MAGRTTFTKRQKEQARQQKNRDKAARKIQRKLEKQAEVPEDANELERLAQEQAALFDVEADTPQTPKHRTTISIRSLRAPTHFPPITGR